MEKRDYLDIQQTEFYWDRADQGYYWEENIDEEFDNSLLTPESKSKGTPCSPYLLINPKTTGFYHSNPMKNNSKLFFEFAEVPPTKEGILAFANKYGPLTMGEKFVITPTYSYPKGEKPHWKFGGGYLVSMSKDEREYAGMGGESLSFWQREIRDMRWTVQLWEWLQKEDIDSLRKVIYWPDKDAVHYILADKEILEKYSSASEAIKDREIFFKGESGMLAAKEPGFHLEIFERFRYGEILLPAQCLLQRRINKKIKDGSVIPRLLMNEKNKLAPYLMPEDLLSAMWLQFFFAVIGEKEYKRCSICGRWEDVSEKRKTWTKHPECALKVRVNKSRHLKQKVEKLWKEGKSPEEINAETGATFAQIQRWIEGFERKKKGEAKNA